LGDRIVKAFENPSLSSIDKITIDRINNVISVRIILINLFRKINFIFNRNIFQRLIEPHDHHLMILNILNKNLEIIMDLVYTHMSLNFDNNLDQHLNLHK